MDPPLSALGNRGSDVGGTFTHGASGRPLDAVDLRNALIGGWASQILWHPSARDSTPVSTYYVDPIYLYRYVAVYADVAGSVGAVVLPDSTSLSDPAYITSGSALVSSSPTQLDRSTLAEYSGNRVRPTSLTFPPRYAPKQISEHTVSLPTTLNLGRSGTYVVWASVPRVNVANYASAKVNDGSLSPVFNSSGAIRLTGKGTAEVRVFTARKFPTANER